MAGRQGRAEGWRVPARPATAGHDRQSKGLRSLSADYLYVLARGLGLGLQVNRYDSQAQALAALQHNEVDVIPRTNHLEPVYADLVLSAPYAYDQAVLISRFGTHWPNDQPPAGTTVLFDPDWIQQERVAALFPQLTVESVNSTGQGLGQVAYGDGKVLLTDAISAQYLLEQSYQQSLKQTIQRDSEGLGFSFAVQRSDRALLTLVNSALSNISPQERTAIARRWGIGANPKLAYSRLQLTDTEKQWIKTTRTLTCWPTICTRLSAFSTPMDRCAAWPPICWS